MSTTGVTAGAGEDKLEDVTTCCICEETYINPKILPCVHTFCLICLQRTGTETNKKPGDAMPCPVCRQEFTVPSDGLAALQKNFFMVRLVEIAASRRGASGACDKHEHEDLCLYCSECEEPLCLVCLRKSHKNHRVSDLSSATNILRSQLQGNVDTAKRYITDMFWQKEDFAQKKIAIREKAGCIEREVLQVKRDLTALIDEHAESILRNLHLLKQKGIKNIETREEKLEKHLVSLKNFEKSCTEQLAPSDDQRDGAICKVGGGLKEQFDKLELHSKSVVLCQPRFSEISFTKTVPEAFCKWNSDNLIGKVEEQLPDCWEESELFARSERNSSTASDSCGISGMTGSDHKVFECCPDIAEIFKISDTLAPTSFSHTRDRVRQAENTSDKTFGRGSWWK